MNINTTDLESVFPKIWCQATSAFPDEWTPEKPAWGQCLSTAWVAKQCLGGVVSQIVITKQDFIHYWNILPSGEIIDFTESQLMGMDLEWSQGHVSELTNEAFDAYQQIFPAIKERYLIFYHRFQQEMRKFKK